MEISGRQLDVGTSTDENGVKPRQYKGIRMRKWGKWVSEVRIPKSNDRIWLGSYHTAEEAARAYDAAVYCLRGPKGKFNFPNSIPAIPSASSLSREQIQVAAGKYALGQLFPDRNNNSKTALTETAMSPSKSPSVSELDASSESQIVAGEQSSAMGESFLAESDDNQWSNLENLWSPDAAAKSEVMIPTEEQGSIFFDPTDLWSF